MQLREIVLGTHNQKKRAELEYLLAPFGFTTYTLDDFPNAIEVVEDGDSFEENAAKKAQQQAKNLNAWVLGEDSGIAVDYLGGAPGIFSARFAGEQATDEENNQKLLKELKDVPRSQRTAHYVCHMALSDTTGTVRISCQATCQGILRTKASGAGGFGYDPLFEIPEYHQTFGELGPSVKSVLSHRARAARRFVSELLCLREALRRTQDAQNA